MAKRSPQRWHRTPTSQEALAGAGDGASASSSSPWSGDITGGDFLRDTGVVLHRRRSGLCGNGTPPPAHALRPGVLIRSSHLAAGPAASITSWVTGFSTSLLAIDLGLPQPEAAAAAAAPCSCRRLLPYWLWITSLRLAMDSEHPNLRSDDAAAAADFLTPLALWDSSRLITPQESSDLQLRDFLSAIHTVGIFPSSAPSPFLA